MFNLHMHKICQLFPAAAVQLLHVKTCSLPFLAVKTVSLQCELFFGVELPSPLMINASDEIVTMVLGLRTSAHSFMQLQAKEGVIHVKICFVNGIDCLPRVTSKNTCFFLAFLW